MNVLLFKLFVLKFVCFVFFNLFSVWKGVMEEVLSRYFHLYLTILLAGVLIILYPRCLSSIRLLKRSYWQVSAALRSSTPAPPSCQSSPSHVEPPVVLR